MKTLIAEDDFTSRILLQAFLSKYGECHLAANGKEALDGFRLAIQEGRPYDLICMDILMPEMDGHEAVKEIRALERRHGSTCRTTIIMTTGLNDVGNVVRAAKALCDAYLLKPIDTSKLLKHLKSFELVV